MGPGAFPIWVVAAVLHVFVLAHLLTARNRKTSAAGPLVLWVVSTSVPALSLGVALRTFVSADPVVQFNAGDPAALGWWSFWVRVWPTLLLINVVWLLAHLCALGSLLIDRAGRRGFALAGSGAFFCAAAVLSVMMMAPRA